MSAEERPLHVRVAEALGLEVRDDRKLCKVPHVGIVSEGGDFPVPGPPGPHYHGDWCYYLPPPGWPEYAGESGEWEPVPRYDIDWCATGPLIERLSLDIYRKVGSGPWTAKAWRPNEKPSFSYRQEAETPLLAVCNLILALAEDGKLPA